MTISRISVFICPQCISLASNIDGLLYLVILLLVRRFPNFLYLNLSVGISMAIITAWVKSESNLANKVYMPKRTLMVYDNLDVYQIGTEKKTAYLCGFCAA